ncbi:MAG: site-specific DNA-methyltransferase [Sediminibacterium sp.]|nr:site-specific DNA-methyltransferase [Sediminibacterium sp.]
MKHEYGFEDGIETSKKANFGNKIIHGDNLEALKSLLPEYEGKIKCIYIDPPYNTGNEGWVYNDNVNDPKIKRWLGEVVGKESEDLTRHDKWLCMMYPRLKLLHRLLSDDGAIFISIDDNELANLKLIMNEVFGMGNFIEYFSWYKTYSPSNLSFKTKKCLEYIICFQKKKNNCRFNGLLKTNEADNPLIKSNNQKKVLVFPKEKIECTLNEDKFFPAGIYGTRTNEVILKKDVWFKENKFESDLILESKFIWTQENLDREIKNNTKIIFKGASLAPRYDKAKYLPEVPRNLIDANDYVGTTEEGGTILKEIFELKVFDYPKPPSLIEYLLNFISEKNSIILDSFAGSGTTAHAVLNLNKQDGGNRKFILIEMEDYAQTITAERVKRVMNGYGDKEGTGGCFDYYSLGEQLFIGENQEELNENLPVKQIREYVWFSETRTDYHLNKFSIDEPYLLGIKDDTAYYFFFEAEEITTLDFDALAMIKTKASQYIIYANNCLLPKNYMLQKNIRFKQIPGDIIRL